MATDLNPAEIVPRPPPLNSNQLNYLIWRYLQEAGYAEAAVKLQRDWKVDTESLSFAKHIKGQALVSLVQKGLRYHHLSLTVDENGQQTKSLAPSMFFFGPESAGTESSALQHESMLKSSDSARGVSPASTVANASKLRSRDAVSSVPEEVLPQAPKRGRKPMQSLSAEKSGATPRKASGPKDTETANGHMTQQHDNVPSSVAGNEIIDDVPMTNGNHDEKMDVDHDVGMQSMDIDIEELAAEIGPPLIPTLTHGESVAIQVAPAKMTNLGPTSAILSLRPSQTITHALWRPSDGGTLLAQGEAFCDVWQLDGHDLQPDSVKPPPQSLFPQIEQFYVTAVAWNLSGSLLAVATFTQQEGQVHILDGQDLTLIEDLPASQRAIVMLKWHPSDTQLIGVAPFGSGEEAADGISGSTILSWKVDPTSGSGTSAPTTLNLPSPVYDIDVFQSGNDSTIYAAGDYAVYQRANSEGSVVNREWSRKDAPAKEIWTFVRGAQMPGFGNVAIAAAADSASLWIPHCGIVKEDAHGGSITGLETKPRQDSAHEAHPTLEFATSSQDGYIRIWQAVDRQQDLLCVQQLRFDQSLPVMTLSYSPDGFCLAGAGYTTARIWNAQHEYNPMALWEGGDSAWRGSSIKDDDLASAGGKSSVNGDGGPPNADHTLAWHSDSKRLAFGLNSQVAIINFHR